MAHYHVEAHMSLPRLIAAVNTMLAAGYVPLGGIAIAVRESEPRLYRDTFYQVLFLADPPPQDIPQEQILPQTLVGGKP
jgi:hypothetical protein